MSKLLKVITLTVIFFLCFLYWTDMDTFNKKIVSTVEKGSGFIKKENEDNSPLNTEEEKMDSEDHSKKENDSSVVKETIESKPSSIEVKKVLPEKLILDVPLLNQMTTPRLYNGCEVTSLTMILNYNNVKVTKNELASKIQRVPLNYQNGNHGNPNVGFVGNMEDGPGLGVYHKPIYKLAQQYVSNRVEDLTKKPFSTVIEKVAQGQPVWVITTTSFSPTSQMKTWSTPQGPVAISFKMHSVVITGYDQDSIYINNPYGTKNQKVNKENFIKAWEQMGSQAVVINGA